MTLERFCGEMAYRRYKGLQACVLNTLSLPMLTFNDVRPIDGAGPIVNVFDAVDQAEIYLFLTGDITGGFALSPYWFENVERFY